MLVDCGNIQVKVRLLERAGERILFTPHSDRCVTPTSRISLCKVKGEKDTIFVIAYAVAVASAHVADKRQKRAHQSIYLAHLKCDIVVFCVCRIIDPACPGP